MNKQVALRTIWDYMTLDHSLQRSDIIFVLGNRDTRLAEYAAKLYKDGWAPLIVFSGSGSIHNNKPGREEFINTTEAEVFASIARNLGIPDEAIITENKSQNTGENFQFTIEKLAELGIKPKKIILVHKPHMERRAHAAGKIWWPESDLIATSPNLSLQDYLGETEESWIHSMVGNLQRIREYPERGFQTPQDIPEEVWCAYELLVALGYTEQMLRE